MSPVGFNVSGPLTGAAVSYRTWDGVWMHISGGRLADVLVHVRAVLHDLLVDLLDLTVLVCGIVMVRYRMLCVASCSSLLLSSQPFMLVPGSCHLIPSSPCQYLCWTSQCDNTACLGFTESPHHVRQTQAANAELQPVNTISLCPYALPRRNGLLTCKRYMHH